MNPLSDFPFDPQSIALIQKHPTIEVPTELLIFVSILFGTPRNFKLLQVDKLLQLEDFISQLLAAKSVSLPPPVPPSD